MKRTLLGLTSVVLLLSSCKKGLDESNNTPDKNVLSTNAKIENGRLSFRNAAAYEQFLSLPDKQSFVKALPGGNDFVSFKNRKANMQNQQARMINGCDVPDSLIDDNPDLFNTLDTNGIVEISGELYRYDYCNQKAWVISAANAANTTYYADFMSGTLRTNIVGSFPVYVDAIEAVAQGYTTMPDAATVAGNEIFEPIPNSFFGPDNAENCYINNNEENPLDQNIKMDGKLEYAQFAVYFHFYGKEKYQTRCFFNWCTSSNSDRNWRVNYWYNFRRKGRSYDETGRGQASPVGFNQNETKQDFYSGNRGLKWADATWDVVNMWTNKLKVERNYGSSWILIANETYPTFRFVNNYQFQSGISHFFLHYN